MTFSENFSFFQARRCKRHSLSCCLETAVGLVSEPFYKLSPVALKFCSQVTAVIGQLIFGRMFIKVKLTK